MTRGVERGLVREVLGDAGVTLVGASGPRGEVARALVRMASVLDWTQPGAVAVWRETLGPLGHDLLRLGDTHAERMVIRWECRLSVRAGLCPQEPVAQRLGWLIAELEREAETVN